MILRCFSNNKLLAESLKRVASFKFLQFLRGVLIEKLVYCHETTANADCINECQYTYF